MTFRQRIEDNPMIWVLSMLVAGFLAGFGAYETILRVSNQVRVSESEHKTMQRAATRVAELEEQIKVLKAREGKTPSAHRLYISAALVEGQPKNILSAVKLDEFFYISSRWLGASANGYYEQRWEIRDEEGLVAEQRHPFVVKEDGEYSTWASFLIRSGEHKPGSYRLRVFLNGQRFEDRELLVTGK
ncbi:MAG: hypothetical protein HY695_16815 [Deltaproteobacteria bacterium]|nr:hypothetical protein [Deltaproteobacteria bacterium]